MIQTQAHTINGAPTYEEVQKEQKTGPDEDYEEQALPRAPAEIHWSNANTNSINCVIPG